MSDLTPQRGAVPIKLDRDRVLFFDMDATFLLMERLGPSFPDALYQVTEPRPGAPFGVTLRDREALKIFLWAGLQADAREHGETFPFEAAAALIEPHNVRQIFSKLVEAVALTLFPAPPPKAEAAGPTQPVRSPKATAKAPSKRTPAKGQPTTLTVRPGLRLAR